VVLAAVWSCFAAVGYLLIIGTIVEDLTRYEDFVRRAGATTGATESQIRAEITRNTQFDIGAIVFLSVAALVLVGVSVGVLLGSRVARVLAWIANGFVLTCCAGAVVIGIFASDGPADTALAEEAGRLNAEATPASVPFLVGAAILLPLGAIASSVLLAVPRSQRFFRAAAAPPDTAFEFDPRTGALLVTGPATPPAAPVAAQPTASAPVVMPEPGPADGPNPWARPAPPVVFRGEHGERGTGPPPPA
jgi:hypothetical protein